MKNKKLVIVSGFLCVSHLVVQSMNTEPKNIKLYEEIQVRQEKIMPLSSGTETTSTPNQTQILNTVRPTSQEIQKQTSSTPPQQKKQPHPCITCCQTHSMCWQAVCCNKESCVVGCIVSCIANSICLKQTCTCTKSVKK